MRILKPSVVFGQAMLCTALLGSSLTASPESIEVQDGAPSEQAVEKAGALFASSCTSCHLPPDPERATDLAWLNQVTDTA